MVNTIASRLCEFATETRLHDVPQSVVDWAKGLNMKTIAGMAVGAKSKNSGRKMAQVIRDLALPGEVGIIASGFKTALWQAVFLHAFYAHASELEDDRFGNGAAAWDITVVPVVTSLAQKLGLSGVAFLEALIVGLEVHVRTTLFSNPPMGINVVGGAMGPAVAAARVLGLNAKQAEAAMGLSLSSTLMSTPNVGTDGHYFESAFHSLQGVMSAHMARAGMAGNPDIRRYMSKLLGAERVANPESAVAGLGQQWLLAEIGIKKYPTCFYTQRQIDAFLELKNAHGFSNDEVESIEVHGNHIDRIVDRPEIRTEEDLPFSIQHLLAAALVDGDVDVSHVAEGALSDQRLRDASRKVKAIIHPEWPREPLGAPARVIVRTTDGREFIRERTFVIGSAEEPLTMEQFRGLYRKYMRGTISEVNVGATATALANLETVENVGKVIDTLTLVP